MTTSPPAGHHESGLGQPAEPSVKPMYANDLIAAKSHKMCPLCNAVLILTAARCCIQCSQYPPPAEQRKPAAKTPKRATAPAPGATTTIRSAALEDLSRFEDMCLWIVAAGKPVTQGSMRAVAVGVMRHSSGKQLHEWRDSLTKEALRITEGRWSALNLPVRLDVVLTVPKPKNLPAWSPLEATEGTPRTPPMAPPDVDKLLRAVQDALSPRDNRKKGESVKLQDRRFRLLEDDSRIIDSSARKTYPAPFHTHPWALPFPGAVIRVSPLSQDVPPLPSSTLDEPAALPLPAQRLLEPLRRRIGK